MSGGAWSYGSSSPCPWVAVDVAGDGFNCSFVLVQYVTQGYRISELPPGACGYTEHLLDLPARGPSVTTIDIGWSCSGTNASSIATCEDSVDFTFRMYSSGDPDAQWGWLGWDYLEDTALVSWP